MAGINEGALGAVLNRLRGLGPNYQAELDQMRPVIERILRDRGVVRRTTAGGEEAPISAFHENPTDRFFAQYKASMAGGIPAMGAPLFNQIAFGDIANPADAAANRAAGDLGREYAARRLAEQHPHPSSGFLSGLFGR